MSKWCLLRCHIFSGFEIRMTTIFSPFLDLLCGNFNPNVSIYNNRLFGPVGLLVGQRRSSGGDLVVFLARTPNSDAEPAPPPGVPAPPQVSK